LDDAIAVAVGGRTGFFSCVGGLGFALVGGGNFFTASVDCYTHTTQSFK